MWWQLVTLPLRGTLHFWTLGCFLGATHLWLMNILILKHLWVIMFTVSMSLLLRYRHLLGCLWIDMNHFPLLICSRSKISSWVVKHVDSARNNIAQCVLVYFELWYHQLSSFKVFFFLMSLVRWLLLKRLWLVLFVFYVVVVDVRVRRFVTIILLEVLVDRWAQGFVLDESIQRTHFTLIDVMVITMLC